MHLAGETTIQLMRPAHDLDPWETLYVTVGDLGRTIGRSVVHDDPAFRQDSLGDHRGERPLNESGFVSRRRDENVLHKSEVRCQKTEVSLRPLGAYGSAGDIRVIRGLFFVLIAYNASLLSWVNLGKDFVHDSGG